MKRNCFASILLSLYLIASIFQLQVYAQQTTTKTLFVSVLDNNQNPLTNLPQNAFSVLENNEAQTITSIKSDETAASVGILFDLSPSFAGKTNAGINLARHGLLEFVKASNPLNEYFIMGFSDQTKLIADWTSEEKDIVDGLNQLPSLTTNCPTSCSKVYDAFFPAFEKLNKSSHTKRILLIVTDSNDHDSKHSQKELMKLVRQKDVLVYPVIISNNNWEDIYLQNEAFMNRLSALTGGYPAHNWNPSASISKKVFEKLNPEFKWMFRTIASTLRSQYEITYQPTKRGSDKSVNKIKLELQLPPDLKKQIGKYKLYHRLEYINED